MARHTWHKSLNRMRDSEFLLLSLEARAVLAGLEDLLADEPINGNLSTLALYLGVDQKKYRLKTHLDTLITEGFIKGASEDRGKKGLWYTLDLPDDHPERAEKKATKDQERPEKGPRKDQERSEKGSRKDGETGVDKSANDAGSGDGSLKEKKILPSEGDVEGESSTTEAREAEPNEADVLFDEAWAQYPKRAGSNSRKEAKRCWDARVKEGVPPDDLLAATIRYRAFCEATGKVGQETVMQGQRFYGPNEQWCQDWAPPRPPARSAPTLSVQPPPGGGPLITTNGGLSVWDLVGPPPERAELTG